MVTEECLPTAWPSYKYYFKLCTRSRGERTIWQLSHITLQLNLPGPCCYAAKDIVVWISLARLWHRTWTDSLIWVQIWIRSLLSPVSIPACRPSREVIQVSSQKMKLICITFPITDCIPCFRFDSVSIKNSIYLYISYSQAGTLVLILLQVISAQTCLSVVASILIGLFMLAIALWEFSVTIVYTA